MFRTLLAPGPIDQNASHGLGCRTEKVSRILPPTCLSLSQSNPSFMDEGRCLKSVVGRLIPHSGGRQLPEFLVNLLKKIRGTAIAP